MISGFLLINKEVGKSSNDINSIVKKRLNVNKVGHLGTLDPFASGLLIIGINEATKLFPYIDDKYKTYIAKLKLGETTSSLDNTTEIICKEKVVKITNKKINEVLNSFIGKTKQVPPKFSAKNINGQRAYNLARKNIDFDLNEIEIEIKDISLLHFDDINNIIEFKVTVSKGTYIRSLGYDIAKRLGSIGYLISLVRESIGRYNLNESVPVDLISQNNVISIEEFCGIELYEIDDQIINKVENGNQIKLNTNKELILVCYKGKTIALYEKSDNIYLCKRKFNL